MARLILLVGGAFAAAMAAGVVGAELHRSNRGAEAAPPPTSRVGPAALQAPDAARGEAVFRICSACHTVGRQGADVDGPNLYGVVGARVAERRPRFGYTQALRDVGGLWTEPRLDAWLTNPAAFAPGTAMNFAGLADPQDRADVIAFLASQGPARR